MSYVVELIRLRSAYEPPCAIHVLAWIVALNCGQWERPVRALWQLRMPLDSRVIERHYGAGDVRSARQRGRGVRRSAQTSCCPVGPCCRCQPGGPVTGQDLRRSVASAQSQGAAAADGLVPQLYLHPDRCFSDVSEWDLEAAVRAGSQIRGIGAIRSGPDRPGTRRTCARRVRWWTIRFIRS